MIFLSNAFSLQMLDSDKAQRLEVTPIGKNVVIEILKDNNFKSCIGHADTANVLSEELGFTIEMNRVNVSLTKDDTLIVAQLTGGRLPEGSTTLPDGYQFKFLKVELVR